MLLPANSSFVRRTVIYLIAGAMALILAANIYIAVHYYSVMPRLPDPQTHRVYRMMVAFGGHVYVNKKERDLIDFLHYGLVAFGGGAFLLHYLKTYLKWF